MTTTLGNPIVVKTLTAECTGPCGGTLRVTTDVLYAAYAVTEDIHHHTASRSYEGQDALVTKADGSIEVTCEAYDARADERCGGVVTLDRETIAAVDWIPAADAPHTPFLSAMGRA